MYDVVVCGGGPAGSALAWWLARDGMRVAIADAGTHPRRKPCGESLNPGAVAAILRLAAGAPPLEGLLEHVQPLDGWVLHSGKASVAARYPRGRSGWSCRREALDEWLLRGAIGAGAEIIAGCRVKAVAQHDDRCEISAVREGINMTMEARYAVGADGLRSVVARSVGLLARPGPLRKVALTARISGLHDLRPLVELHLQRGAVIGIAPLQGEGGAANATLALSAVEAARRASSLRSRPEALLGALRASTAIGERAAEARLESEVLACGPFHYPVRAAHRGRVLLVGDAAGYYDPLTGQGIYRALRGAELAAGLLRQAAAEGGVEVLQRYSAMLQREFGAGTALQRFIEYGAARPRLFQAAIHGLRLSGSASLVAAVVGNCREPRRW
ncbi:NAD(P)/FAD-dependent oxidoreductase [Paenibacillus herberti]|uniref:FAD-binding domain-containing protein n=1 Tax=Paenibacillus herberti TaxID=1619309 RepID=A0A229P321_9BACL|nr:NAD(P)/FAD-dependent oxidoreductase [Paenibacillus herberti]OXM16510.1 hypothetical protein CGZ75_07505 [Paenibacillus herberti]